MCSKVLQVLAKLEEEPSAEATLLLPHWPSQPWWPMLMKLSDELQFHVRELVAKRRPFILRLLHAVLAEQAVSCVQKWPDALCRMGFRNCHQRYGIRLAPGDAGGVRDLVADFLKCWHGHGALL